MHPEKTERRTEEGAILREIVDQLLSDVCRDWKDSVIVSDYIVMGRGASEISTEYGMSEDLVYQRAHER